MLSESKTGYLSNFDVYLEKAPPSEQAELGMAAKVVLNISKPFHNTNRHLYFDNFFNSTVLLEELLKVGTYGCGTLRANRYPGPYKAGRSSIKLHCEKIRQLQKGNSLVTVWYNKHQVAIVSTNCKPNETVKVQRRTKQPPHIKDVDICADIHIQ